MRISDWSSDVCSSDLRAGGANSRGSASTWPATANACRRRCTPSARASPGTLAPEPYRVWERPWPLPQGLLPPGVMRPGRAAAGPDDGSHLIVIPAETGITPCGKPEEGKSEEIGRTQG